MKSAQVDYLMSDLETYRELTSKSAVELDNAVVEYEALEVRLCVQYLGFYLST